MAEGRLPRVGDRVGEALSKNKRNQEQFDGKCLRHAMCKVSPPPTPHSSSPPPSFWLALDWTHVGQPELPLAVKLFNWSLIGCDCSALGARCRPCFLTLQAKVMIPTAAPAPASALPFFLQGGRISFSVLHHQRNEFWHFTHFTCPPLPFSHSSPNPLASHLTSTTNERALLSPWPHSFLPFPHSPFLCFSLGGAALIAH